MWKSTVLSLASELAESVAKDAMFGRYGHLGITYYDSTLSFFFTFSYLIIHYTLLQIVIVDF